MAERPGQNLKQSMLTGLMIQPNRKKNILMLPMLLSLTILAGCASEESPSGEPTDTGMNEPQTEYRDDVTVIGEMRNVMWNGELAGIIDLQTLSGREHLYGLGPVEYLRGEILILDGISYKSTVVSDTEMHVETTFDMKAPFFGYATIAEWTEHDLPASVQTIPQLEEYLAEAGDSLSHPFMFKLLGMVDEALIHIVNLPEGTEVSSPAEAHQGQIDYPLQNEKVDILGFYSTEHQRIFTHRDSFVHMHLITADRQKMGHLDEVKFRGGTITLSLPVQAP